MFVRKSRYTELEESNERQKQYYEHLITINEKHEHHLHKQILDLNEANVKLECDLKTCEFQIGYLSELIGKLRDILGLDDATEASSQEPDSSDHTPCE